MGIVEYLCTRKICQMKGIIRRIYTTGIKFADTKTGLWLIFIFGIADASILPFPVTTLFLGLCLIYPRNIFRYSLFLISGLVTGSLVVYLVGHYAWINPVSGFTGVAKFFMDHIPGFSEESYSRIHSLYSSRGWWILLAAIATPLPYGILAVSAGVFNINLLTFLMVTLAGNIIKFSFLGFLAAKMEPQAAKLFRFFLKPAAIIPVLIILITLVFLRIV